LLSRERRSGGSGRRVAEILGRKQEEGVLSPRFDPAALVPVDAIRAILAPKLA